MERDQEGVERATIESGKVDFRNSESDRSEEGEGQSANQDKKTTQGMGK